MSPASSSRHFFSSRRSSRARPSRGPIRSCPSPTGWNCGSTRARIDAGGEGDQGEGCSPTASSRSGPTPPGRGGTCGSRSRRRSPTLVKVGDAAVVRFDGEDDHLRLTGGKDELKAFTRVPRGRAAEQPRRLHAASSRSTRPNGRDYETGLTIDMGPNGTPRFTELNVEGKGFGGWRNLMKTGRRLRQALPARSARRRTKAIRARRERHARTANAPWKHARALARGDHGRRAVLHERPRRAGSSRARAVRHRRGAALQPRADRRRGEEGPRRTSTPSTPS